MRITLLGTAYDVQTGADAINFLSQIATSIGRAADDMGGMARDIAITKGRVDQQQRALQQISRAGRPGTLLLPDQGNNQLGQDALALLAARNQSAAPVVVPIAPPAPQPPPVPVTTPSIHRSLTTPPVLTVLNPSVQALALGAGACDRTHSLSFTVNAPIIGGAGFIISGTFGTPYATTPTVQISEQSLGSSLPVAMSTPTQYRISTSQSLLPGTTYQYAIVTVPTTENFD